MDTEKENDAEETNEDAEDKEADLEETSNAENISAGYESDDNSETVEWPEESAVTTPEVNDTNEEVDTLVPVVENVVTIKTTKKGGKSNEKQNKSDDAKQSDNSSKQKNKGNQKEDNGKKKVREEKPFTKVVIRRLPPTMTKEVFLDQVSPLPPYDYFYFVSATMSSPGSFSRAYINFTDQNDLFNFTLTFDNYVFIDSKGHEYPAIVEFAPYQRVPKPRPQNKKKDTLVGTIESDPIYLTFKEQLQAEALESSRTTNKQHYFETEINESEEVVTTPLLEFLKARRAVKDRIREERREDRKRKEVERKLLKQKIKEKPAQEEEIEIKTLEDYNNSFRLEDSSSSSEDEDLKLEEGQIYSDEPVIKAILSKPRDKSECEKSECDIARNINDLDVGSKFDSLKKLTENTDKSQQDSGSVTSEERDRYRSNYYNKSYSENWEQREPGDMYRFSKYRCWERQGKGGSGFRYHHNRYDSSESYCHVSSSYSFETSVLQPPKEKKEFTKEKDSKRIKHKDKDDRFIKPETRTREFKNKGGKSYREERLKQAEKREEKKKKEIEDIKETKDEVLIDEEIKEEEKFWNDKKKWKYGGGGDNKGGRTFSRRRDEKKKDMFERKKNNVKPNRTRKGSGESLDDNQKKEKSESSMADISEKITSTDKSGADKSETKESLKSPKKDNSDNSSSNKQESTVKKDHSAHKQSKDKGESSSKDKDSSEHTRGHKRGDRDGSDAPRKERLQKESSVDSEEGTKSGKDPRAERRIRNKDRPSIEIYRPGMGKFSRQRLEKEKTVGSTDESPSHSPSPTPNNNKAI